MNRCRNCSVIVDENMEKCPLCHQTVNDKTPHNNKRYPSYHDKKGKSSSNLLLKLTLFLASLIISTCALINLFTDPHHLWVLYVAAPILYLLLLINNTIFSKSHLGTKTILQVVVISSLLFSIDFLTGFQKWSVNFVVPFLIIAATLLITGIITNKKMRTSDYVGYIMMMIVLGIILILLYFIGISSSLWASAITFLYTMLTLIGMFIFSGKSCKNELIRKFHF